MTKSQGTGSTWGKWIRRLLLLILLAAVGIVAWNYLKPLILSDSLPIYESFVTGIGDIRTTSSYSAAISIINRQNVTPETTTGMNRVTVRTIDVKENQSVREGDRLAQLSTGEVLTAEFDGVVNAINYSVGDRVRGNNAIMDICDFDDLQMAMSVDEYDIDSLQVGQPCTVTVVPLGLSFETKLEHINRISSGVGNMAYYQVTAKIDAPSQVLPGMQASVTFPAETAENVTTLDIRALAFDETGSPYVLLQNSKGEYEKHSVETGLSDGMQVEILSGLEPGQTVWTVTGTRKEEPAFTLQSLYQSLMGETVIINDQTARTGRGNQRSEGTQMPQGRTPEESAEAPAGEESGQNQERMPRQRNNEEGGNGDET